MLENSNIDPGELNEPPLPPKHGIPRQTLPKWLIKAVQLICLPYVCMDLFAKKIATYLIRPPFMKTGKCKKRGNCCYYIRMRKVKYGQWIQHFWATQINGFYYRSYETIEHEGKQYYLMGCRHLKNNKCSNYFLRPQICRSWPLISHFGQPLLLKGCGYKVKLRKKYEQTNSLNIIE